MIDDYESEDEDAPIINGGTKSLSVDETVKDKTNGEDKESAGRS
jgi:hypothetical protein